MSRIFWMAKKGGPFPFNTIVNRKRFYKLKYCICNRYIEKITHFPFPSLLELSGGRMGLSPPIPLWFLSNPPSSPPSVFIASSLVYSKIIKNTLLTTLWFYHKSSIGFHSTLVRIRVRMGGGGGSVSPDPTESKQKLFTFDDNGPRIILILPNSSDIAMHGFPYRTNFQFRWYLSELVLQMGVNSGVLKLEPQTFQWIKLMICRCYITPNKYLQDNQFVEISVKYQWPYIG